MLGRVMVSGNSFIASSTSEGVGLWRRRDLACDAWRGGRTAPGSKSNQMGSNLGKLCFKKILRYMRPVPVSGNVVHYCQQCQGGKNWNPCGMPEKYSFILNHSRTFYLTFHFPPSPHPSHTFRSRLQGRRCCRPGRRLLLPCFRHGLHH